MRQMSRRMEMMHLTIGCTWLVDPLICITCSLKNNAFSVLHYVMVTLHYSRLHQVEMFSAPGTMAHGSIRLPPHIFARLLIGKNSHGFLNILIFVQ